MFDLRASMLEFISIRYLDSDIETQERKHGCRITRHADSRSETRIFSRRAASRKETDIKSEKEGPEHGSMAASDSNS